MINFLIGAFLVGLSFGAGPCMSSCGVLLISYVTAARKDLANSLFSYLFFSIGRVLVYLLFSLIIYFIGKYALSGFLRISYRYLNMGAGAFIIVIGLFMLVSVRLGNKPGGALNKFMLDSANKNVFVMGMIIALLPCAPLIAVLSYLSLVSKSWLQSILYSFFFGIGTIVSPLLLLVGFAGLIPKLFKGNTEKYYCVLRYICSVIIIILGILMAVRGFYA